jgi:cytochrome c oxidase subunit 2
MSSAMHEELRVGRFWSILFLMVPVVGVGIFVWAMAGLWPMERHWLPENINDHGAVIDNLFLFILVLTGVIFIVTGIALFWFLWKYDASQNTQPVAFTHGSHTLEVVWSIIPAATLVFIAIYQMNAWADAKMRRPTLPDGRPKPETAEITGRQFEWRIRYPHTSVMEDVLDEHGKQVLDENGKPKRRIVRDASGRPAYSYGDDDVYVANDLHLPVNEEVVLKIKSQDVLHSFFLPNLRVKQDVVPGMKQFVWFRANKIGAYDIVCAELCGWGHYKMRGRVTFVSREDFDRWLTKTYDEQNRAEFKPATGEAE